MFSTDNGNIFRGEYLKRPARSRYFLPALHTNAQRGTQREGHGLFSTPNIGLCVRAAGRADVSVTATFLLKCLGADEHFCHRTPMSTFSLLSEDHLQDLYEFHTLWMTSCRDSTTSHIQQACSQGPLTIRPPICQYVSKHEAGACDWLIFMEEPRRRKKPETDQSMLIIEISCGDFPSFMQQPFDND